MILIIRVISYLFYLRKHNLDIVILTNVFCVLPSEVLPGVVVSAKSARQIVKDIGLVIQIAITRTLMLAGAISFKLQAQLRSLWFSLKIQRSNTFTGYRTLVLCVCIFKCGIT